MKRLSTSARYRLAFSRGGNENTDDPIPRKLFECDQPDVHYISLEKDFSNAGTIIARLDDLEYLQGFADRAYERLVKSGDYGYRSLARLIEQHRRAGYPPQDRSGVGRVLGFETPRDLPTARPEKRGYVTRSKSGNSPEANGAAAFA